MQLELQKLELKHALQLFDALNHVEVGEFIGGPDVTTLSELEDRIAHLQIGPREEVNQRWFNFAVLLESVVIGRVEATAHDAIVEIAYLITPSLWGQGLGTTATELLLNQLQNEGEDNFWATTVPENTASTKVLENLGFIEIDPRQAPLLLSYDEGDRVFQLDSRRTV
jgi:RimJ/RimL family protein N-acetyltransferase